MCRRKNFEVPYCENPAVGMGAPECSEDCYKYGACNKDAYFKFIAKKHSHIEESKQSSCVMGTACHSGLICHKCGAKVKTVYYLDEDNGFPICIKCKNKKEMEGSVTIGTNYQFTHFVIDGREYYTNEIVEILKKHKEEEDKKYHTCKRCGDKYLFNTINMISHNLEEEPEVEANDTHASSSCVYGYQSTPFIKGFKILSTCGNGKSIGLCDNCIADLIKWLNRKEG